MRDSDLSFPALFPPLKRIRSKSEATPSAAADDDPATAAPKDDPAVWDYKPIFAWQSLPPESRAIFARWMKPGR